MLAILFSALAPTVSHALNTINVPSATLEICSVNGGCGANLQLG